MAVEVVVPILGYSNEKGKILRWLKSEGDLVKKGEPLLELETEKVVTEIESPATGILKKILIREGVEVPVLTVIAIITEKGEDLPEKYRTLKLESPLFSSLEGQKPITQTPQVSPERIQKEIYDIAILGAGPGGYVSAIRASQLGAKVLLIEKDQLGGTCLNRGCIPTKSFLSDIKILRKVKESDLFVHGDRISLNLKKMISRKNQVVETLKRGIASLLQNQGITLVKGHGRFIDSKRVQVSSNGKGNVYQANHMLIATGSKPVSIPKMKFDGRLILSTDQALNLQRLPKEILIIGGGVIGVEFATIFHGLGSRVKLIEMLPQILSNEDEELVAELKRLMEKEGIEILTETEVLQAHSKNGKVEVEIKRKGRRGTLLGDNILVAVGRAPNTEGLNIDKIGLEMEGNFVKVNSKMETNVEGIYAIGDVIGKKMLAHAASAEGIVAVENIMGKSRELDYQKVPNCIYTFPEIASVGLKETEAKERGYEIRIGKFPFLRSGMAWAIGETEGFVKIIAEKGLGQILGVHILGDHATELIGEILLAINLEASIEDLGEVIKGHPTLSESITEAAKEWQQKAIHSPSTPSIQGTWGTQHPNNPKKGRDYVATGLRDEFL